MSEVLNRDEIRQYYESRVPKLKDNGPREWRSPCPVHKGTDPNFSIDKETGLSCCHSSCSGRGFDVFSLEMELHGLDFPKAKESVYKIIGRPAPSSWDKNIREAYEYRGEDGTILFRVCRLEPKKFIQQRPGTVPGKWVPGRGATPSVPYHLPQMLKAKDNSIILGVCEGERDVHSMERVGWVATCNDGGATNFKPELVKYFKDRHVAIFPDNDEPGRKHALLVAKLLYDHAASVKIVELPGLPLKGDVTDFLNSGKTGDDLHALYHEAQEWTPEWNFPTDLPHENDKYLRSFGQYITEVGGREAFWKTAEVEGLPTPFEQLTEDLGGLRNGEVYILGANEGEGKSSLGLQFALKCMELRKGVLYFSMEMGHQEVFQRIAAIDAHVDLRLFTRLRRNCWDKDALDSIEKRLNASTDKLSRSPLFVTTKSSISPEFLMKESLRVKERGRISLVVVDHTQLMSSAKVKGTDYERFTDVSRLSKEVAMEIGVPLLMVSQTSRGSSRDKRNELENFDLRSSGALEEDAAAVMLLFPNVSDFKEAKASGSDRAKKGPLKKWLKLSKNRYGPRGEILKLWHYMNETRFEIDTSGGE